MYRRTSRSSGGGGGGGGGPKGGGGGGGGGGHKMSRMEGGENWSKLGGLGGRVSTLALRLECEM